MTPGLLQTHLFFPETFQETLMMPSCLSNLDQVQWKEHNRLMEQKFLWNAFFLNSLSHVCFGE